MTCMTSGVLVNTALDGIMPLWGDYDHDGFIDLFLSTGYHSGSQNDRLYHNEGGVGFRTVTAAEVGAAVSDNAQDQAFGWGDHDNDGDLDLFVAYMAPPFDGPASNFVFRNSLNGPFEKIALTDFDVVRQCWGASWGDYYNDGYPDVFLPSWFYTNALFKNLQGQGFTNVAATAGLQLAMASQGSAWGDYDNDGCPAGPAEKRKAMKTKLKKLQDTPLRFPIFPFPQFIPCSTDTENHENRAPPSLRLCSGRLRLGGFPPV